MIEERLDRAYAARTRGELAELVRDLPEPAVAAAHPGRPRRRRRLSPQLVPFLAVNLMLIAI